MAILKRVTGIKHRVGGEEHSGWLPPGAAVPPRTPVRELTLDLRIESEASGFVLYCEAREAPSFSSDTWCDTLAGALALAHDAFGVEADRWRDD